MDPTDKCTETILHTVLKIGIEHQAPWDSDEYKSVVDNWENCSSLNIVLDADIHAIISVANLPADDAMGYSEAACKDGNPHDSKEHDNISVGREDSPYTKEEKKGGKRDRDREEPGDNLFEFMTITNGSCLVDGIC